MITLFYPSWKISVLWWKNIQEIWLLSGILHLLIIFGEKNSWNRTGFCNSVRMPREKQSEKALLLHCCWRYLELEQNDEMWYQAFRCMFEAVSISELVLDLTVHWASRIGAYKHSVYRLDIFITSSYAAVNVPKCYLCTCTPPVCTVYLFISLKNQ